MVACVGSSKASGLQAGSPAEGIYLQTGIVGNGKEPARSGVRSGLESGVFGVSPARFLDPQVNLLSSWRGNDEAGKGEQRLKLAKLSLIIGCHQQLAQRLPPFDVQVRVAVPGMVHRGRKESSNEPCARFPLNHSTGPIVTASVNDLLKNGRLAAKAVTSSRLDLPMLSS